MIEAPKPFCDMLDWKLKSGSHEFPGPDGGTCINEAAIIAAGFEYKKVGSWKDCPPCFSPLISQFALGLNDDLNDTDRQALMPFVTRMAGTKGSQELEDARALWLVQQIVNIDLAKRLHSIGEHGIAVLCEKARSQPELKAAIGKASSSPSSLSLSLLSLLLSPSSLLSSLLSSSLSLLSSLSLSLSLSLKTRGIELLEGLINFEGAPKQEIETPIAIERLAKAKEKIAA